MHRLEDTESDDSTFTLGKPDNTSAKSVPEEDSRTSLWNSNQYNAGKDANGMTPS